MNTVYLENIILSLSQPLPLSPHSALSFSNLLAIFIHSLIMFVVILIPHSYMFALLLMTIFLQVKVMCRTLYMFAMYLSRIEFFILK